MPTKKGLRVNLSTFKSQLKTEFLWQYKGHKKCLKISLNAKKNKQDCTFMGNRKTWFADNDMSSITVFIINMMDFVRKNVVQYRGFSDIAKSVF